MQFAEGMPGIPLQDLWDDIPPVLGNERIGYPTQKPLALLERIIKASSNESDVVLDPFWGCATACIAAQNLARQWTGVDISPKAVELVNMRLQQSMGNLFRNRLVTARTEIPSRTDIDVPVPYRQTMHVRFGQQEGRCNGCRNEFPFRVLEVDRIIPLGGWPGQHRQPATTANSLQSGQTRLASGVPKPIPRWDVHVEGLEDYRKDPNTTAADQ